MSKAERKWRGYRSRAAGIVQRLNTVRADLDELHREMTAVGFGYHRSSPPAVDEWFSVLDALAMAGEGMDDDADRLDAAAAALDKADWTPGDYSRPVERTDEDAHALKDAAAAVRSRAVTESLCESAGVPADMADKIEVQFVG